MNRINEYKNLKDELTDLPYELEYSMTRAEARLKKSRLISRFIGIPVGTLAILFVAFVILVNSVTSFAFAMSKVPVLKELTAAVALSPSLKAAVENDYVQPLGLEQTKDGITLRIDYLIVDQKQVNLFYFLEANDYPNAIAELSVIKPARSEDEGYAISGYHSADQPDGLKRFTIDFFEDVPPDMTLNFDIHYYPESDILATTESQESEPPHRESVGSFDFDIQFDPSRTAEAEVIELGESIEVDGQVITMDSIEIYPTHLSLKLSPEEANTAWLQSMDFTVTNEKGDVFSHIQNGINATGETDSPAYTSYRLESPYFSQSEHLTLGIQQIKWLDKKAKKTRVDLINETAEHLPQDVELFEIERRGEDWELSFLGKSPTPNTSFNLFDPEYFDQEGESYEFNGWSNIFDHELYNEHAFEFSFILQDYDDDIVYLTPSFSRLIELEEPIKIKIK